MSLFRGRSRRVLLACFGVLVLVLLWGLFRPLSRFRPARQMRIFAPEQRVQNFRSMDQLFPSRPVHRSGAPFHFRRSATPAALRDLQLKLGGKSEPLDAFLNRTTTTGLLIARDDELLDERYFLGTTEDSPLTSWSMAKSVVSLLTGIAIEEGRLAGVDHRLSEYAPALSRGGYAQVTIQQALQMSSGIRFDETYSNPFSDINMMFVHMFALNQRLNDYVSRLPAAHAPGTAFEYVSVDTQSVGMALRAAVGKPLTQYLEEKLWGPLGMEYDAFWNVDREDRSGDPAMELAFCCLNVRLRDYAKIGRLAARGGDWNGRRIVSEAWMKEATQPKAAHLLPANQGGVGYQYQWWVPRVSADGSDDGAFMAIGVWGQFMYVQPRDRLVIVKTSVDPRPDDVEHAQVFAAIAQALRAP